jgi:hypothetical protein
MLCCFDSLKQSLIEGKQWSFLHVASILAHVDAYVILKITAQRADKDCKEERPQISGMRSAVRRQITNYKPHPHDDNFLSFEGLEVPSWIGHLLPSVGHGGVPLGIHCKPWRMSTMQIEHVIRAIVRLTVF